MSTRSSKRPKTTSSDDAAPYELIYWPGIPGRGEHIRLAFEEAGVAYTDVSNSSSSGIEAVLKQIDPSNMGDGTNPPPLAPPILKHGDLVLSQTPNILLYLGPRLGLVPDTKQGDEAPDPSDAHAIYHINQLVLTALDGLSNETHDTHHPVATGAYYEDQKPESKRKAADFRENRLPKFLAYFERVLKAASSSSSASKRGDDDANTDWLYGNTLTYADLVLFQVMDGNMHAFPKCMARLKEEGKYGRVFGLYERVKARERIKDYLASERRLKYGMGIYRRYPELDDE